MSHSTALALPREHAACDCLIRVNVSISNARLRAVEYAREPGYEDVAELSRGLAGALERTREDVRIHGCHGWCTSGVNP